MKKWIVKSTSDTETFKETEILGTSYTNAYVNFMVKYPDEMITEIREASNA